MHNSKVAFTTEGAISKGLKPVMEETECTPYNMSNSISIIEPELKMELFDILPLIMRWEVQNLNLSNLFLKQNI